jgi:hypothetical protein
MFSTVDDAIFLPFIFIWLVSPIHLTSDITFYDWFILSYPCSINQTWPNKGVIWNLKISWTLKYLGTLDFKNYLLKQQDLYTKGGFFHTVSQIFILLLRKYSRHGHGQNYNFNAISLQWILGPLYTLQDPEISEREGCREQRVLRLPWSPKWIKGFVMWNSRKLKVFTSKTNTIPILMHQKRISTN